MSIIGIQIFDRDVVFDSKIDKVLEVIDSPDLFNWKILYIDGMPKREYSIEALNYINKINKSKEGIFYDMVEMLFVIEMFDQIYELTLISSKNIDVLRRYKKESEMIQSCDISIILVDCSSLEFYSKDGRFITKLSEKFDKINILTDLSHVKN